MVAPEYSSRHRIADGYPGLNEIGFDAFDAAVRARPDEGPRVESLLALLDRLIDLGERRRLCVVGCGPHPDPLRIVRDLGFAAVGIEPVPEFVAAARDHVGNQEAVLQGSLEQLPLPAESQDVVFLESVLEHVDSVGTSLREAWRVLKSGGVAYISTTNRHELRRNGEFTVRGYQWLPRLVKESYVFRHLHYDPSLAHGTERPAVHWFTYADLCEAGREAGFYKFYSPLDLKEPVATNFAGPTLVRRLKAVSVTRVQRHPWLRAAALTQRGGVIFMLKR